MKPMPLPEQWPKVIFGSTPLGNIYRAVEESTKREIITEWFKHQSEPVFVDSAGKYGAGLALESMAKHFNDLEIDPDSVVISNKLGWKRVPLTSSEPTFEPGAWFGLKHDATQVISYDGIMECFEQGNHLLGDYRAQMLSVHDPDEYLQAASSPDERAERLENIRDGYRALADLRDAGHAQCIGIGAKDWKTIQLIHSEGIALDWVMFANSYTIMRHPAELRDFMTLLQSDGVAIINSAVYHGGFVTGGDFFDYAKVTPGSDPELFAWRDKFEELCLQFDVTPARAACHFALSPTAVRSIAISTSRPDRVQTLVDQAHGEIPTDFRLAMREAGLIDVDW